MDEAFVLLFVIHSLLMPTFLPGGDESAMKSLRSARLLCLTVTQNYLGKLRIHSAPELVELALWVWITSTH
jgi:hypothetical protein